MNAGEKCERCRFWQAPDQEDVEIAEKIAKRFEGTLREGSAWRYAQDAKQGWCRRFPEALKTRPRHWCGEFRDREVA